MSTGTIIGIIAGTVVIVIALGIMALFAHTNYLNRL